MPYINGKWKVDKGDSLWNIASVVYNDAKLWTIIANANGIPQSTALISPDQLLIIPPRTGVGSAYPPGYDINGRTVFINYWGLNAGEDRTMTVGWSYSGWGVDGFDVTWWYRDDTLTRDPWIMATSGRTGSFTATWTAPANAKGVRVAVTPLSAVENGGWGVGNMNMNYYDFANNPPSLPPAPTFSINNKNELKATTNNIPETINADYIEYTIYQDDNIRYQTLKGWINFETRYTTIQTTVEPGHSYKIRCRAVRGDIYGAYTDFTEADYSLPLAPTEITALRSQTISEQQSTSYAVFVEWMEATTAKTYVVEWTNNVELFGTSQTSKQTTEEGKGPRLLIPGINLGFEYFFRVASINQKGQSLDWSSVKSVTLGTKPSPPTTYSNVVSCVTGEDLKLYWVHNSTDGSFESYARLQLTVIDSAKPNLEPLTIVKVIKNTKPEEDKGKTSVYTINSNDPDWALLGEGFIIKWKVQTAGVTSEYSKWSTERQAIVYTKPKVEIDIKNNLNVSINEINTFPFYISVLTTPTSQIPLSYYVEIVSNGYYKTVDNTGVDKVINIGDKVYTKYYDPQSNPWKFLIEMSPANIDLENNVDYTINVSVSMNSGLTAVTSKNIKSFFNDIFYEVNADVIYDTITASASIHPYCYENIDDEKVLVDNCMLSVYRINYDGKYIEIAKNIDNSDNVYVVDPHPSLDYARYRIVAKMNDTGAISYGDIQGVVTNEKSAIIQWSEEWKQFELNSSDGFVQPAWSGSMIKIPYNITISDSKSLDVSLIKYAGREHPVSYYGTQLGETSSWTMSIPKDDKETLYALRRLSKWTDNVYVREPYGSGYWANISVNYNLKYQDVTIPVSLSLTRVEGGM